MHKHFDSITSLCNVKTVDKVLGDSNLLKKNLPPMFFYYTSVISWLFLKWCSSGVVRTLSHREITGFIGFSGTFQDTAVADKKFSNHTFYIPSQVLKSAYLMAVLAFRDLLTASAGLIVQTDDY